MSETWAARFPGVDIVLIEPDLDDEMFETSLMSYSSRVEIAEHGFRSVTHKLAGDYDRLKEVCARHGVEISAERVRGVLQHFAADQPRSQGWRRIFEQTTGALLRQSGLGRAPAEPAQTASRAGAHKPPLPTCRAPGTWAKG